jgi:hypothetical protein
MCLTLARASLVTTVVVLAMLNVVTPVVAEDPTDPCESSAPGRTRALSNFVWTGTVLSRSGGGQVVSFQVDHVYANRTAHGADPDNPIIPGTTFRMENRYCVPLRGLQVGLRYLVATQALGAGPDAGSTAVWRLEGDDAALVHMWDDESTIDSDLLRVRTLQEALALILPRLDLPDTGSKMSTASERAAGTLATFPLLLFSGLIAAIWFVSSRPRRTETNH